MLARENPQHEGNLPRSPKRERRPVVIFSPPPTYIVAPISHRRNQPSTIEQFVKWNNLPSQLIGAFEAVGIFDIKTLLQYKIEPLLKTFSGYLSIYDENQLRTALKGIIGAVPTISARIDTTTATTATAIGVTQFDDFSSGDNSNSSKHKSVATPISQTSSTQHSPIAGRSPNIDNLDTPKQSREWRQKYRQRLKVSHSAGFSRVNTLSILNDPTLPTASQDGCYYQPSPTDSTDKTLAPFPLSQRQRRKSWRYKRKKTDDSSHVTKKKRVHCSVSTPKNLADLLSGISNDNIDHHDDYDHGHMDSHVSLSYSDSYSSSSGYSSRVLGGSSRHLMHLSEQAHTQLDLLRKQSMGRIAGGGVGAMPPSSTQLGPRVSARMIPISQRHPLLSDTSSVGANTSADMNRYSPCCSINRQQRSSFHYLTLVLCAFVIVLITQYTDIIFAIVSVVPVTVALLISCIRDIILCRITAEYKAKHKHSSSSSGYKSCSNDSSSNSSSEEVSTTNLIHNSQLNNVGSPAYASFHWCNKCLLIPLLVTAELLWAFGCVALSISWWIEFLGYRTLKGESQSGQWKIQSCVFAILNVVLVSIIFLQSVGLGNNRGRGKDYSSNRTANDLRICDWVLRILWALFMCSSVFLALFKCALGCHP